MPQSTVSLNLTAEQVEVLVVDMEIDKTKLYAMNNNLFRPPVSLPAYTNGHYIIFTDGTADQHEQYVTAIYGADYAKEPLVKSRGLTVYGGPTYKFLMDENLVTVVTVG
jgi:hypothetical protein